MIVSDETEIRRDNVLEILNTTLPDFEQNSREISYLYEYYLGNTPIDGREKKIRPEINNKIKENHAHEIVAFKVGYGFSEPVQYVQRGKREGITDALEELNNYMFLAGKHAGDKALAKWWNITGIANRLILPNGKYMPDSDEAPFLIYTLDPRESYAVHSTEIGNPVIGGVMRHRKRDGTCFYSVHAPSRQFIIRDSNVEEIPIAIDRNYFFEYPADESRLGAFEGVISILDALDRLSSNRMDGVEQFVQAIMIFKNCRIDEEDAGELREKLGVSISGDNADVKLLCEALDQTQVQMFVDYLYQTVLNDCGMPNRNGGSSTSDTGSAVYQRDGWNTAEGRAKDSETTFKQSEIEFLKTALLIAKNVAGLDSDLKASDIDIKLTRRNYENLLSKAQVLTMMLGDSKIHPLTAFQSCGMFTDPGAVYQMGQKWYEEMSALLPQNSPDVGEEQESEGERVEEENSVD